MFGKPRVFQIPETHTVYKELLSKHCVVETEGGYKAVYCPVGVIMSFHPEDVNKKWCHFCHRFFTTTKEGR